MSLLALILASVVALIPPAGGPATVTSPGPSPSPSSTPRALKTIVTVISSPYCNALADHFNSAMVPMVANDRTFDAVGVQLDEMNVMFNYPDYVNRFLKLRGQIVKESDTLIACGEALLRSFTIGQEVFTGINGKPCKLTWLPDVFGYSACLPQMMNMAGVSYFFTTKMTWNMVNRFPYSSFIWRGNDGSSGARSACRNIVTGKSMSSKSFCDPFIRLRVAQLLLSPPSGDTRCNSPRTKNPGSNCLQRGLLLGGHMHVPFAVKMCM